MNQLWYWVVFAVAVLIWVAVPVVAWLERRSERRDREAWERQPGAVPETTLRDLAAELARQEWQLPDPAVGHVFVEKGLGCGVETRPLAKPDMRAAADAELGARIGHGPGRRADQAQTVREQSLDEMRLK